MANSSIVIFKITGNKNEVNELKEKMDFVVEKHKGAGYVSFVFLFQLVYGVVCTFRIFLIKLGQNLR